MKVLQINCVYGHGSTGTLTRDLHHYLQEQGIQSLVCYGRGKTAEDPGVFRICSETYAKGQHLLSCIRGIPYGGCLLSTWRLLGIIGREKPDVVHLQCCNGYFVNLYLLLSRLKRNRIPTVLTLHAEFPYTGNCAHAFDCEKWKTGCGNCPRWKASPHSFFFDRTACSYRKMREAVRGFGPKLTAVSVSSWLRRRAEQSPILDGVNHRVIGNGIDTEIFTYRPGKQPIQERILFHATALFSDDPSHPKGGYYLLELARQMENQPVRFLVAGKHRINGEIPPNVTLLGEIRDQNRLAQYYSAADLTILTSRAESFSLVCAESLCCGTPVAGFRAGGPEEIALDAYSRFVEFGDVEQLLTAVQEMLDTWSCDPEAVSRTARKYYGKEHMLQNYLKLYQGVL